MKTKKERLQDLIVEYANKNFEFGLMHDFEHERKLAKAECKRVFKELTELLKEFPD